MTHGPEFAKSFLLISVVCACLLVPQDMYAQVANFSSNLSSYWSFDEGEGVTTGAEGALMNGVTWSTDRKVGSGALDFDGVNDSVKIPNDIFGVGEITIGVWIYPRSNGGGKAGRIISNTKTQLWLGGSGQLLFFSGSGNINACGDVISAVAYNTWSHIIVTRDVNGSASCYVNGIALPTAKNISGAPVAGSYSTIGNYSTGSSFAFDGKIDDVRVYNKILSQDEIKQLAANTESSPSLNQSQIPRTSQPSVQTSTPTISAPQYQSTSNPAPIRTISWNPPLGIPEPSFGIKEDVTMYLRPGSTYDYGKGPEPYRLNSKGEPFTHYVDKNHPAATDTNNPFGIPDKPRKTIPGNLIAGSVVELHGGPYLIGDRYLGSSFMYIHGTGEASKPIFVRGATGTKVLFETDIWIGGSYIILENLKLHQKMFTFRHDILKQNIHHISIRHTEVYGDNNEARNGAAVAIGPWMVKSDYSTSHIVVYNLYVHDLGLKSGTVEYDYGGVGASGYDVFDVWVVDNKFENLASGNRFGNNEGAPLYANSRRGYFGRNTFVNGGENAFAIKQHNDVIVSENVVSGFKVSTHNSGSALNILYNPTNVWLLFNKITDATDGIKSSGVKDLYIIGNDISNVGRGVNYWSGGEINIIGNTITNIKNPTSIVSDGVGIYNYSGFATQERRNIVGNIISGFGSGPDAAHYFLLRNTGEAVNSIIDENLFYSGGEFPVKLSWLAGVNTVSEFATKSGKCAGCMEVNPGLVSVNGRLTLSSNSPGINQWDPRSINYIFDRFEERFGKNIRFDALGNARPSQGMWDIGAYEYNNGQSVALPPIQNQPSQNAQQNPINSTGTNTNTQTNTQVQTNAQINNQPNTQTPVNTPVQPSANTNTPVTQSPAITGVNLSSVPDFNMDLSRGSTAKEVLVLQTLLVSEGYLTGSYTDGIYDKSTEEAVRNFQRKNNISSFGTVNAATRLKLNELLKKRRTSQPSTTPAPTTPSTTVSKLLTAPRTLGTTHLEIQKLQQFLNNNGFTIAPTGSGSKGKETTYFGPGTLKALNRFQIAKSLTSRTLDITTVNLINTLATATSTPVTTTTISTTGTFTRTLSLGMSGPDVLALQQFLNTKGFTIATSGPGSKGNETTFFGAGTKAALIKFQEAYKADILTPNGLTKGTGSAGPSTIKKINSLR